jgi:signal transduction histidine kinase
MTKKTYEILIVDDTKTMRMIIQAVLSNMDANFDHASEGQAALTLIKSKQYDVIISDIHMPVMTGLELTEAARKELKFKNLPILIMTTDNDYSTVEKVFQCGATDFISKPINEFELTSRVKRILEQRKTEKELYIAKASAVKANQRKSKYLANVNHELKTPLNGIYGYAQVLQSMVKDSEKLGMINTIVNASEQMTHMINQLLELEQIEAGHVKVNIKPIKVADIVNQCITINQPKIQSKRLVINQSIDTELMVNSDQTLLFSVFSNILSNAIKYNKTGGSINIINHGGSGNIQVKISDSGIGMNEDQVSRIFDPFSRFTQLDSIEEGHGLGMAITKSTADVLGIEMDIQSELDIGTSVSLYIN